MTEERERLVLDNTRLVHYIAKRYVQYEHDDIYGWGVIGLQVAAEKFDFEAGYKFATFATPCIINTINMYLRRSKKHEEVLLYESPIGRDNDGNELQLKDTIAVEEAGFLRLEQEEEINILKRCIGKLTQQEQTCLRMYFGLDCQPRNQRDIAKELGLSQSYIARVNAKSLEKLKKMMEKEYR